ncbi:hypothetical protein RYX36_029578 [Vicia faba]
MDSIRKLSKHQVLIAGGNKDINGTILEECSNLGLGDSRISGAMATMTYYESKVNTRLRTYYQIHLIAGGNKDNPLG